MKKRMRLWQFTLGYVICVGIIFSMFVSRITISSDRIIDCTMNILDDAAEKYENHKGQEDGDWADLVGDVLDEDKREDIKENVEKTFGDKKVTCSSAQIMFASKYGVEKYIRNITGVEEIGENEREVINGIYEALFWPRVMLFVIYFFPVILIILYYLTYWKRWRNLVAIITTWVYIILAVVSNILWYFLLPIKGAEKMTDLLGSSLGEITGEFTFSLMEGAVKDLLSPMLRHAMTSFTGGGMWIFIIGSILLFIYSFLLLLMREPSFVRQDNMLWDEAEKKYAGSNEMEDGFIPEGMTGELPQDVPIIEDIIQQRNSDRIDYNRKGDNAVSQGAIYITKGSMAGAEIFCMPEEQIVVGRDPNVSDLVLSHPKISRKHFVIQYDEETKGYQIFCFSKNGIYLSTGGKIGMSQSADIPGGIMITMADGAEELVLE